MKIWTLFLFIGYSMLASCSSNAAGEVIDEFQGVKVYGNGSVSSVHGRHLTEDGYNLGLKWQCAEFVKRYYVKALNHKMPESWGHARDYFKPGVEEGKINYDRSLLQFPNGSKIAPQVGDILIIDGWWFNKFGHVAIVSHVSKDEIEIVQQNKMPVREKIRLEMRDGTYWLDHERVLGWLHKE